MRKPGHMRCALTIAATRAVVACLLFILISSGSNRSKATGMVYGRLDEAEKAALVDLFGATGGNNGSWNHTDGWANGTTDPCGADGHGGWYGVVCGNTSVNNGSVLELQLASNGLRGGPLPYSLVNLTRIEVLVLTDNALSGDLPNRLLSELQSLVDVELNLNGFTGTIDPGVAGNMTNVTIFDVANNRLHGEIPGRWGSHLEVLRLNDNGFFSSIPAELGALPALQYLDIWNNTLSGTLSPALGNLSTLIELDLYNNSIGGTIPDTFGQLRSLQSIGLSNNLFTGSIPRSFANLTRLQFLYGNNLFLSGSVPDELGRLTSILYFQLSNNSLTGTIPASLYNCSVMTNLWLHENDLHGTIPRLPETTQTLLLYANRRLRGGLPPNVADMKNLYSLDVSDNSLSTKIDAELFHLSRLTSVGLGKNCWRGDISRAICNATSLQYLSLDGLTAQDGCGRSMDGCLPSCVWQLPELISLHASSNGLCGSLPSGGLGSRLVDVDVSYNRLEGDLPYDLSTVTKKFRMEHNRVGGTLRNRSFVHVSQDDNGVEGNGQVTVSLDVNRLSCAIDSGTFSSVITKLSVLTGNLFGCPLPSAVKDADSESSAYLCGSRTFVLPFSVLSACLFSWCAVVAYAAKTNRLVQATLREFHIHSLLQNMAWSTCKICCWAAIATTLLLVPLYATWDSAFRCRYSWSATLAYVTEATHWRFAVLCLALAAWLGCFAWWGAPLTSHRERSYGDWKSTLLSETVFVLCVGVTVGPNVLYIYVESSNEIDEGIKNVTRLGTTVVKTLWSSVLFPNVLSRLRRVTDTYRTHRRRQNMLVRLNVMNYIIVPLLVTLFVDSRCLLQWWKTSGTASSTTETPYCGFTFLQLNGDIGCLEFDTVEHTLEFDRPFLYSEQCATAVITAYSPILIQAFALSGMLVPAVYIIASQFDESSVPGASTRLPGILWPSTTRAEDEHLFFADGLLARLVSYLAVCSTFGMFAPYTCIVVALACVCDVLTWNHFIGRYEKWVEVIDTITPEMVLILCSTACVFFGFMSIDLLLSSPVPAFAGPLIASLFLFLAVVAYLWLDHDMTSRKRAGGDTGPDADTKYVLDPRPVAVRESETTVLSHTSVLVEVQNPATAATARASRVTD